VTNPTVNASTEAPQFAGVSATVARVVTAAGPYLTQLFQDAAPTPAVTRALADEVRRAQANPRSVAHPELADPDAYWSLAAWPRAVALVKHARSVLIEAAEELAAAVQNGERVLELWFKSELVRQGGLRQTDPDAARAATIDGLVAQCQELHRTVEGVRQLQQVLPAPSAAQTEVDEARRRQAEEDVRRTRADVEREHADADPAAFKDWWNTTFEARLAVRDAELHAVPPFRHQELAIAAFEQARGAVAADIDAMIGQLTEPILGFGQKLVVRHDELLAEVIAAEPRLAAPGPAVPAE
jgi:hypothetical protein